MFNYQILFKTKYVKNRGGNKKWNKYFVQQCTCTGGPYPKKLLDMEGAFPFADLHLRR